MENDGKCIAILEGTFTKGGQQTPEFKEYSERSNANGQAHGGKLLGRFIINANLGQGKSPHAVFNVEFPSRAHAEAAFSSEEYKSILDLREIAFEEVKILLSEDFDSYV